MLREIHEVSEVLARQLAANADLMREIGSRLRSLDPPFAATVARGSSAHAAAFGRLLLERHCDIPALAVAPVLAGIYGAASSRFAHVPLIAISQSGRSPDILATARLSRERGALVIAMVNDETSPLATLADLVIPLRAGPERSVAATKTFLASLAAVLHLVAEWSGDERLLGSLQHIPSLFSEAPRGNSEFEVTLRSTASLLCLGRGYTLPIAAEAALKLKETCGIHAEPFSTAEVFHGPVTLLGAATPALLLMPGDEAKAGAVEVASKLEAMGATLVTLEAHESFHPALEAMRLAWNFYILAERLAVTRSRDPDRPPRLRKVTETL